MNQGDESPLFSRDDTPPRSGVPPGYTSIRPLLLQRQQSSSSHQTQRSIAFEDEVLQDFGETDGSPEEDNGTSSVLVNLNNDYESDTIDAAPMAAESDSVPNTFLSIVHDQVTSQSYDESEDAAGNENQVSPDDSFSGSREPSDDEYEQTVEVAQPQRGSVGDESPLFCREDTPPRCGVPPGYQSLRSVIGRRVHERHGVAQSPVTQHLPAIAEEPHGSFIEQQQPTRVYPTSQHSSTDRVAFSGQTLSQYRRTTGSRLGLTAPQRPQPRPRPVPTSQPASTQSLAQQQRPILPYVFQPSSVPQTPVETTLAAPLITKREATSGTAVYPSYSPVTTTTAEGLYTLTDAQVYWNSRGRPQCFKVGCDNNQGIGYRSEYSRDQHISNTRFHKEVPHLGYEQTKRGYQNGRDYPLLHKMASEEFHKIMADLREREKRLNDNLAALEDESRAYIRDHRELLVAIENDQGPTRPPQHPVAEALNTFHSTQWVGPPAVASGDGTQPVEDEDSLFVPENAGNPHSIPENAENSHSIPENAGEPLFVPDNAEDSLFVPEDARVDEPVVEPPPRPKRRVTFSDAPATILGATSPSENVEFGDPSKADESFPLLSPSNDVNIGYDQPTHTGSAPVDPEDGHVNATQEIPTFPVTSDDTNIGFDLPVYTAFDPISSENGHVNTAQESFTLPVASDDTVMDFDQPIYTGNRRPSKRARHSSRTPRLMLNTGFTPALPDNKPATDPQEFVGTYDPQNFVGTYDPQDFAGAYNPQNSVGFHNPQDFADTYDPRIPTGGPIEPWQSGGYVDMTAESKLPDHVDSHFVCPYPDCGKLYVNSGDVEQHLEHDHPDWALIKDAVIASDTPNDVSLPENW
ncbi:hypothetical protein KCV07_g6784, partial [Aureobasidium melanogenum]